MECDIYYEFFIDTLYQVKDFTYLPFLAKCIIINKFCQMIFSSVFIEIVILFIFFNLLRQ